MQSGSCNWERCRRTATHIFSET